MEQRRNTKLLHHVTFSPRVGYIPERGDRGSDAELRTVGFLIENLNIDAVGDYHMLVNYNLPMRGAHSLEIDIVLINRFGVFLLEVKGWIGHIEAFNDAWIVDGKHRRDHAFNLINSKARTLHTQIFGNRGELSHLRNVCVTGLVVLTQGTGRFKNSSGSDAKAVFGLGHRLLQVLSSTELLQRGSASRMLENTDIQRVTDVIYRNHLARQEKLVENYRILKELSFGDLFEAYEAQDINITTRRVRLKRYQFQELSQPQMDNDMLRFTRNATATAFLGYHPHILNTLGFFPDRGRPDVFYEITELVSGAGARLDEIMARTRKALSLEEQLHYLEPLCEALAHAHNHKGDDGKPSPVYHRNVSPETVFVTKDEVVKLADFDFAKFADRAIADTLVFNNSEQGKTLVKKPYTAPEVLEDASIASPASDIYALGVLWYFLACLPRQNAQFDSKHAETQIDALHLPEAARALMKRMVAAASVNRPQSTEEVLRDMRKLRENIIAS